ncbi:MAG: rhodanese-like domain-containing protein [Planctomycetota bacterium]
MSVETITAEELRSLIQSDKSIELLDVRTPAEFREVHLTIARNMPLDQLDTNAIVESRRDQSTPLYVICKSGTRGRQACERLIAAGCSQVLNIEGGTAACEKAGLVVVRGRKAVSLERQVRIAAGSLVVGGIVFSRFVHPWLIGLSGFVGAGLIFAGITDTCGMAMLLARMPWNRA